MRKYHFTAKNLATNFNIMTYFTPAFLKFFKDLSKNNTTEWFNDNRKTYEKEVKEPFAKFIDEMIARIRKHEPDVNIKASDAIMRINKDIRFSKDKTPYNTHVSANISRYGKKDKSYPGFFIQLNHEGIQVFGGVYMVEKDQLEKIRKHIAKDLKALDKAVNDKTFVKYFGAIQGEKAKRLDPTFNALVETQPLIANKQFYFNATLPKDLITSDKLADELMKYYEAARPVSIYFQKTF